VHGIIRTKPSVSMAKEVFTVISITYLLFLSLF
jgi:hypothetical protein